MLRFGCCKTGTGGPVGLYIMSKPHTQTADLCQELWLRSPVNLTVRADMLLVKVSWVVIHLAHCFCLYMH